MPETRRCPQCQAELPPDAPEGLCPECLLKEAMRSGSELSHEQRVTTASGPGAVPPPPEELARHFPQLEILELLGQGGMGIVYKARQPRLDRLVALKILPEEAGRDPAFAERFAREARALAKLTHPGVVAVYDFGQSDGRFYLLMEFVDGVNLRHVLREGRLKPEEALKIVPQICEALQYAHDQGVVHRDIKPENILLDRRGHVKIADFGLAKLLGQKAAASALTGSGQVMGTPHYMAPEQMEKPLAVDHRADIYSLGVVFYEMLTGELPLGRFAPPSQRVAVDVRLDEVVLRALEKEPERRYQHASDVKAEVETITHTGPQRERPAAAGDHGRPPQDAKALSRPLPLGPLWVVAVVCLGLLFLVFNFTMDLKPFLDALFLLGVAVPAGLWLVLLACLVLLLRALRVGRRGMTAEKSQKAPLGQAEQLERLVLPFLPGNKIAAIKVYRERAGASRAEAEEAVEAIARKHGLPLSPSSLLNSPSTWGVILCALGIAASFIPAVTRHIYNIIEPGQTSGNQRWTAIPDTGLFSWEWTTITATFLALGLFLTFTHSVRRLAAWRALAMILAGIGVLVVDVLRAQSNFGPVSHLFTTPYIGFYVIGTLAIGLLILGVIEARLALTATTPKGAAGPTAQTTATDGSELRHEVLDKPD